MTAFQAEDFADTADLLRFGSPVAVEAALKSRLSIIIVALDMAALSKAIVEAASWEERELAAERVVIVEGKIITASQLKELAEGALEGRGPRRGARDTDVVGAGEHLGPDRSQLVNSEIDDDPPPVGHRSRQD